MLGLKACTIMPRLCTCFYGIYLMLYLLAVTVCAYVCVWCNVYVCIYESRCTHAMACFVDDHKTTFGNWSLPSTWLRQGLPCGFLLHTPVYLACKHPGLLLFLPPSSPVSMLGLQMLATSDIFTWCLDSGHRAFVSSTFTQWSNLQAMDLTVLDKL